MLFVIKSFNTEKQSLLPGMFNTVLGFSNRRRIRKREGREERDFEDW